MKHIIILVLVFTLGILELQSQPRIEFDCGSTYDWGNVKLKDSPLTAKVKIWNRGNDTLFIKDVKPGCGCTTAPLDRKVVPPKKYATLDISLNIKGYSGIVNKDIRIYSNTQNSVDYLFLKADVFREIETLDDCYFNLGEASTGKEYSKKIRVRNNTAKDIKITKIDDVPDYCKLDIKIGSVIPAKGELIINAMVKPITPGPMSFSIKIQTEISEFHDFYISGWGNVKE